MKQLGLTKDTSLSQKKDRVYIDENGKAHIVYRGTNPLDIRDLATDAAIAVGLGRYTPRFRNGKRLARRVEEKYGDDNVTAYGHSLGGALATESGVKERVTYNKAVGVGGIGKQMRRGQIDYRHKNDLASALSDFSKYKNKSGEDGGARNDRINSPGNFISAHDLDTLN